MEISPPDFIAGAAWRCPDLPKGLSQGGASFEVLMTSPRCEPGTARGPGAVPSAHIYCVSLKKAAAPVIVTSTLLAPSEFGTSSQFVEFKSVLF